MNRKTGHNSHFTIIGSASGIPVPDRCHASLLFQTGRASYLLDAGEGCSASLLRCGIDHHAIGHIFISHMHPDHCSGLPMLIQMMYLAGRERPLELHLPREGIGGFSEWLKTIYIFPEKLPFQLTLSPVREGDFFQDNDIHLTAKSNTHLHGYRELVTSLYPERTMESYSFFIDHGGSKITCSGDIRSLDDLVPDCQDTAILFLEATHVPTDNIFPFLIEQRIGKTVLTHIPPELEGREEDMYMAASKNGVDNLIIAADGLEIPV